MDIVLDKKNPDEQLSNFRCTHQGPVNKLLTFGPEFQIKETCLNTNTIPFTAICQHIHTRKQQKTRNIFQHYVRNGRVMIYFHLSTFKRNVSKEKKNSSMHDH